MHDNNWAERRRSTHWHTRYFREAGYKFLKIVFLGKKVTYVEHAMSPAPPPVIVFCKTAAVLLQLACRWICTYVSREKKKNYNWM